jgi:hypothetical protein
MDRKVLLEYYLNKYVTPEYLLIKRIQVNDLTEVKDSRIDVNLQVICDDEDFKRKINLTESLEEMFVDKDYNTISQTFLLTPIFKESKDIDFERIKKEIKHYIKIIINKRINLFKMDLKLEKSHSDNDK